MAFTPVALQAAEVKDWQMTPGVRSHNSNLQGWKAGPSLLIFWPTIQVNSYFLIHETGSFQKKVEGEMN